MTPTTPRYRARLHKKYLTPSTKGRIIGRHASGASYRAILKLKLIPRSTVRDTIKNAPNRPL